MTTSTRTGTASTTSATRRPRAATVGLWVLQVLLAAVFVMAALPKVGADPVAVAGFDLLGLGTVGMVVVGWLELAGAVALLVPRLCGLAAVCQVALMVGATAVTVVLMPAMVAFPALTLVAVCVVAWARRRDTAALLRGLRR
ncbi:DoxX family protein [Pseudonocardia alni]|uniref:DoxX family protein n=1 Tax=Pseudonocardia alni TaxID=33907 RepID=UPI00280C059D|nr:DoxX family protein [Pseudonocardia alni]